jgi:transcriptional regulator with XRE-family HTH domain
MNGIDYKKLGLLIKEKRKKKNLTQKEFGEKIGKTESSIRKYEKGLIKIPNDVLEKIANFFNFPFSYFISLEYDNQLNEKLKDSYQKEVVKKVIEEDNNLIPVKRNFLPVEKMLIENKIDDDIWNAIQEYIGHRFLRYKMEIDKYELHSITEKVFDYLKTLTNECFLKKKKKELEDYLDENKNLKDKNQTYKD